MLHFECDYTCGAHEKILRRLCETNMMPESGYGFDSFTESAKEKIRTEIGIPDADIYFLVGGTQTNQTVIDALLRQYEGVVSAKTGHINAHESGAIEYTGHKVLSLPHENGKIKAETLENYLTEFFADANHDHMVFPGMVYISHPTEYGTLYTKSELTEISDICKRFSIPLYMDGARLGYGVMSRGTDLSVRDIAELCDVFYIGGTKVGALCGEAVIFTKNNTPPHFFSCVKQHGALLAKGRLLGVQFDTLFTDGLYFEISRHAIEMADKMRDAFRAKNYRFFIETTTNQIFVILPNTQIEELSKSVIFDFWEKYDAEHTVVRFASSWSTADADVDRLIALL